MANENIFLGSGASITFIPESDIFAKIDETAKTFGTTSGSPTATISDTSGLHVGLAISGSQIPAGTTITAITTDTSVTLSQNATATSASASLTINSGTASISIVSLHADFTGTFSLVNDLYVGCIVERYNSSNALQSSSRITSNTATTLSFSPSQTLSSGYCFLIREYGAPVPAPTSTAKRLLSDQWLGLLESATFPNTEVEMKQMNLS